MINFIVNNNEINIKCNKSIKLLSFLRNELKLTGVKEGCGEGECGACAILIGNIDRNTNKLSYKACVSCLLLANEMNAKHIITIEGLALKNKNNVERQPNLIQEIFIKNFAVQCGFCTPGIIIALIGYLLNTKEFTYQNIINALDGNLCRCTGYVSIKKAILEIYNLLKEIDFKNDNIHSRIECFISKNILPDYFLNIENKIKIIPHNYKYNNQLHTNFTNFEENTLIAGGTDICIQKFSNISKADKIIFTSCLEDINYSIIVNKTNDFIIVDAGVTVEQFRNSKLINIYYPSIKQDLLFFASSLLRNNATIVGNIVNASPIGDLSIILLALNIIIVVKKITRQVNKNTIIKRININNFFKNYKVVNLEKDELIIRIEIPIPSKKIEYKFNFEKVAGRKYLDIASCNSAMYIETVKNKIEQISISAGGVSSIPTKLNVLSKFLNKKIIDNNFLTNINILDLIEKDINPRDGIRGSKEYKKLLLKQLIKIHFTKLFPKIYNFTERNMDNGK